MPVNSFDHYPLTWRPEKARLKPPYGKALAEDLEEKIRSGELKAGTKLPPQREIADYLDLHYTTITRAYDACRKKGLIYGEVGRGTFVAPHGTEDVTIAAADPAAGCIELGAINGFEEYSELVERATESVIRKGYLRNLFEYSHPAGHPHQRAAGARWLEQLGAHADREQIGIFAGAQNALAVALIALFSPGDRIAVDRYTYSNLIELSKLLHLVLIPVDGDGSGMLPEALERQCGQHRIGGIYLIPTCSNPTTVTIPEGRRRELAGVIRRQGLTLIEDDIAAWLSAAAGTVVPSFFDLLGGESIYICGMTKSLCPGLRIAYMAFGDRYREGILHGLQNVNMKTSSLDAEIITELILNGDAYEIAARKRGWAERNCRLYEKYFPVPEGPQPAGYYRWLPIRSEKGGAEVERELLERGVRIYHSDRFAVAGTPEESFLRVSLCSARSRRELERGLRILKDYVAEQR